MYIYIIPRIYKYNIYSIHIICMIVYIYIGVVNTNILLNQQRKRTKKMRLNEKTTPKLYIFKNLSINESRVFISEPKTVLSYERFG